MLHFLDKKHILSLILLLTFLGSYAQITTALDKKKWFKADNAFEYGDYLTAIKLYESIIKLDSNNQEINYNLGVSFFELKKNKTETRRYFNRVKTINYREINYYLGRLHHLFLEYEKAITRYKAYKIERGENKYSDQLIDDLIAKSHTALLFDNSTNNGVQIINLGETINSEYADYSPLISAEEEVLYFTSRRKNSTFIRKDPFGNYYENIYSAQKQNDNWLAPKMMDTTINTNLHDACTGISADGEQLLIFQTSTDRKSGNIYESLLLNNKWSEPKVLNQNVNSIDYTETSACYAPNGDIIFFSSNRDGGYGGKDIYYVKKLQNGEWGEPYNLGANINTKYNEHAPFVHPSGKVLFFSSEGHTNMGGYDIFKSNFDESGAFDSPINMGYPINTVDDDVFFVLNADESIGYMSSEREGGFGSHDIYKVIFSKNKWPLSVYKINVYDESNNLLKKVEMEITDVVSKKNHGKYKSNKHTGKIIIISEPNKEYEISIKVNGYQKFVTRSILKNDNHISFIVTKNKE